MSLFSQRDKMSMQEGLVTSCLGLVLDSTSNLLDPRATCLVGTQDTALGFTGNVLPWCCGPFSDAIELSKSSEEWQLAEKGNKLWWPQRVPRGLCFTGWQLSVVLPKPPNLDRTLCAGIVFGQSVCWN